MDTPLSPRRKKRIVRTGHCTHRPEMCAKIFGMSSWGAVSIVFRHYLILSEDR
jgi:hypothetical protein